MLLNLFWWLFYIINCVDETKFLCTYETKLDLYLSGNMQFITKFQTLLLIHFFKNKAGAEMVWDRFMGRFHRVWGPAVTMCKYQMKVSQGIKFYGIIIQTVALSPHSTTHDTV